MGRPGETASSLMMISRSTGCPTVIWQDALSPPTDAVTMATPSRSRSHAPRNRRSAPPRQTTCRRPKRAVRRPWKRLKSAVGGASAGSGHEGRRAAGHLPAVQVERQRALSARIPRARRFPRVGASGRPCSPVRPPARQRRLARVAVGRRPARPRPRRAAPGARRALGRRFRRERDQRQGQRDDRHADEAGRHLLHTHIFNNSSPIRRLSRRNRYCILHLYIIVNQTPFVKL